MTGIYLLSVMRKEVASIVTMHGKLVLAVSQMGTGCVSLVWGTPPLALNGGSGTDAVMILSVSQCTLRANQVQTL